MFKKTAILKESNLKHEIYTTHKRNLNHILNQLKKSKMNLMILLKVLMRATKCFHFCFDYASIIAHENITFEANMKLNFVDEHSKQLVLFDMDGVVAEYVAGE